MKIVITLIAVAVCSYCVCSQPADLPKRKSGDLACQVENPDAVCAAMCQWTTGKEEGHCDENDKCICEAAARTKRSDRPRGDLACRRPEPNRVCAAACHFTTGVQKGHCDENNKCICESNTIRTPRPTTRT